MGTFNRIPEGNAQCDGGMTGAMTGTDAGWRDAAWLPGGEGAHYPRLVFEATRGGGSLRHGPGTAAGQGTGTEGTPRAIGDLNSGGNIVRITLGYVSTGKPSQRPQYQQPPIEP